MRTLTIIYAGLFGLCFGSFANVVIYRLPRGESLIRPASRCPACEAKILKRDLIPVFGWILLFGKCRFCRGRISVRYPAVEFCCGALFAAIAAHAGAGYSVIALCLLAFILLCVALIDIDTQEISDGLIIAGVVLGILWIAATYIWGFVNFGRVYPQIAEFYVRTGIFAPLWYDALLGAFCGAAPLLVIDRIALLVLKKDGFGYGDVKLMAMAGLFLGWRLTIVSLFFAVVTGGIFAAALILSGRIKKDGYFAFAPFLAAGILAAFCLGERFLRFLGFA